MRILHILDHSLPLHSGYAFRTIALLREQRALGWETFHLTTARQGITQRLEEDVAGWHFFRARKPAAASIPGWRELREMAANAERIAEVAAQVRPDILHPHSPVLNALPAIRVGRRLGIPVVYEMRASWEDAAVDHGSTTEGSLRYRLSRALETMALRRADQVTTICEGLRGDIVSRGVAADKVTVIANAVDVEAFAFGTEPDTALRSSLDLVGKTVVGFAGSFYGYEGLNLLVSAIARLTERHPNIRLLLVGGGPQEAALRAQVAHEGLTDRVIFIGRVPQDQVGKYYDLIDVLAYPRLPIRLTELVTPLKPLEAMAQGRMFVASDVGGHRELVRHGETGFLFEAGSVDALVEAIAGVLDRRSSWPVIRAQARAYVERERTWTNSVARYRDVYGRALAGRHIEKAK